MSDLHRNSRFLRFLRSICSKTAFARRAIVALFVAVATILATFMIMPSASMGASQQGETKQAQTQSEKPENKTAETAGAPAKNGSAANGENSESKAEEPKTVKPNNPQPSTNPDAPNADHAQNVDSGKKQGTAKEDANKNPNQDVKKDAKDAKKEEPAKKSNRQKRSAKEDDRAAAGNVELPEACKNNEKYNTFAKCYTISYRTYGIENHAVGSGESRKYIYYDEYPQVSKPEIKIAGKKIAGEEPKNLPEGVWLELTNGKVPKKRKKGTIKTYETAYEWAFFKNSDGNYISKFTEKSNSDGFIRFYPSKWPNKDVSDYRTIVKVHYPDNSVTEIIVKASISYNNLIRPQANDLTFNIYNHEAKDGQKEVDDSNNSITIDSTSTDPSADDTYNPITPLFIHSSLKQGIGTINHRMVCNKSGTQDYSLDGINGLTLSGSSSGTSTNKWVQSTHNELKKRPNGSAKNSGDQLYEDDDYREQSRSWITGTPQKPGTYVCKVFALKDARLLFNKVNGDSYVNLFNSIIRDKSKLQSVFEDPMNAFYKGASEIVSKIGDGHEYVNDGQFKGSLSDKKNIDWDVKTIKIVVKSKKKPNLVVGDNDLTLKVYPFKNNDAGSGKPGASAPSALADGDTVSAMLGMELKPSIEATSEADSRKTITLKMLCSKGEKPQKTNSGDAGGTSNSDGTSNGVAAGGSGTTGNTDNKGLVYTKWEEPSKLGFTFPDENAQKPCTSDKDKQTCSLEGSTKNFAATTKASATFKSAEAGDYQCVVYALKPEALTKFNEEVAKTGVTPSAISAAFAAANLTANKNLAKLAINIHVPEDFTLPHTGEWNWNLQLGAIAAVMVSVLAAGFVASQSDSYRKLFYERRRC
ncbi:hypothetical protein [Gardnerella greenwoodii]|uniref:LPXTG-motif protein cell wall anchor domain protein n=1 Tax=Gardnerella greenwoodii TaxID=2914925 RepID=A0A2N6RX96_9BIFI|nr:hypothetical protein [Gardnerella greenwoodii]MDF0753713.1 hypothetical protein [Gardnerella greenwoodii]PMC42737.1 hypothetical protein CJ216_01100 [Gardnerella greenwoodii]